ncbi:MAG: hypothetical protein H6582_03005 [Crocinitomicaceae bacterium]|nr:hypothetical protein [Crocinitomicaceae bacterium]
MPINKNSKLGWFGLFFVVFHTAMIVFYAAPEGYLPKKLVHLSSLYSEPIFEQKWSMFAPCPIWGHHIEIKYEFEDGDTTDWISPTEDAVSKHMIYRGTYHGDLAVAEYNTLHWLNGIFLN